MKIRNFNWKERRKTSSELKPTTPKSATTGRSIKNDPKVTRNSVLVSFLYLRPAAPWR